MESKSLKVQIQATFARILLTSIAATIITYLLFAILIFYLQYKAIYPANYYEQQIPAIESYIKKENVGLLNKKARRKLEETIPESGIGYQVLDNQLNLLYGNMEDTFIHDKEQLYDQLNTLTSKNGYYIRTIPLIRGEDSYISGVVLLCYQLKMTYTNHIGSICLPVLFTLALISPFLYMILFTILYSRKFSNQINYPLTLLNRASKKIMEKDLDFEINYHAKNELGDLCTAFSEMKEELKHSLSAQWEMERDRVDMVESLAHDLKTPLSIIESYSEALLDQPLDKEGKISRYLSIIKKNANKSATLVRQMQYSTDLEKDTVPLHLIPVVISSFMEQKIRDYELQANQKNIQLFLTVSGNTQNSVLTDREKLERILDNLLSNHLEYTPQDGEIHISVQVDANRAFYKITDSGCGFGRKDLEKAFLKFYRGDTARNQNDGHSGLGLYISRQLVEKLGGTIQISNKENSGACVEFWHKIYEDK